MQPSQSSSNGSCASSGTEQFGDVEAASETQPLLSKKDSPSSSQEGDAPKRRSSVIFKGAEASAREEEIMGFGFKRKGGASAQETGTAALVLPLLSVQILTICVYWLLDAKNWKGHITPLEGCVLVSLSAAAATSCFTTVYSVLEVHYLMLVGGIHITDDETEAAALQYEIATAYSSFDHLRHAARNSLWASVGLIILAAYLRACQAGGHHMYRYIFMASSGVILFAGVSLMCYSVHAFRASYIPLVMKYG